MNISTIANSLYTNNVTNNKQFQKIESGASKAENIQKPDAMTSATKSTGGDHYFEAKV